MLRTSDMLTIYPFFGNMYFHESNIEKNLIIIDNRRLLAKIFITWCQRWLEGRQGLVTGSPEWEVDNDDWDNNDNNNDNDNNADLLLL